MSSNAKRIGLLFGTLAVAGTLFPSAVKVQAKPEPKVTGTYSDMHYVAESGDVVGTELKIAFTGSGYTGALQIAEGIPGNLVLVPVVREGSSIHFTIAAPDSHAGSFHGTLSHGVLQGEFKFNAGGRQAVALHRGKSYWD